jgi:hypothetical protein
MRKTNSTLLIRKDFNIECVKERLDCESYHYQTSITYQTKFELYYMSCKHTSNNQLNGIAIHIKVAGYKAQGRQHGVGLDIILRGA